MHSFADYHVKENMITAIDARLKLLAVLSALIMILSCNGLFFPLIVIFLGLILFLTTKLPLKVYLKRFSEPIFIAFVLVILKLFFAGDVKLFSFNVFGLRLTGHSDGLAQGLFIAGRIFAAVSVISTFVFLTPFTEIIAALSWFKVPRGFTEILILAYRYVFVLMEDAQVIYNAQKNRLGYANMRKGLDSFGILAGSLVLKAFEQSQNTTAAMIQRGYDGRMPVSEIKPFKISEVVILSLFVFAIGLLWKI